MRAEPCIRRRVLSERPDRLPPDLHPVLRRVLLGRGIATSEALDLGLRRLHPPTTLGGLGEAAALVADTLCEGGQITVVGDFDADGATGTALAVRALRAMGAERVDFRVPNRFEFGYGLTPGLVDTLADAPPDLVITVDSGICCNRGVERARALGVAVLVTDHHLPGETLPAANAIVNPNLPGDPFPSKALAGVGVVFYLLSAVRRELTERGWFSGPRKPPRLAELLDLVALGTIADVVPLDHNNRVLVRQGMERIRQGMACPGLLALLKLGKRDYRFLVASDLAFAVAPRLNAAGRMEDMSVGIRCLLSDDPEEATELAGQLDALNRDRRRRQQAMEDEAMAKLRARLRELQDREAPPSLCLYDDAWHQGIVGLVASRVKEAVHRPVVVFAPESGASGLLKGSARSVPGLHIRDALALVDARQPGLIHAFGGHAMAAGLTLAGEQLRAFAAELERAVETLLGGESLAAEVFTDGELAGVDINLELASALRELGPWGQHFPEPLFEGAFEILDQRVVGGAHLKLVLRPLDAPTAVDAIAFNTLPEDLPDTAGIRMLYRLDVNHFRGERICQLVVERVIEPSSDTSGPAAAHP
ncbi:MAG: single-stranded-DNA-specific exonuclease RecJ [Xanthomonadales bacterium]|uniref:single-stranded-DNA-specific exonuclease RecJ n=1 Tax=Hydrogenophaga sp. TaxID=1904254 RepID=UPI0016BB8E51|nr:single-stranded-DNA-specific exonuclease RecJ [Hydrogenophaga sp.]NIM69372.1 single-stranded-DNA-specific exonuclease RecJ [Xanthomonadales bacterium]NIN32192.1 single-stranded-DNA-specific exonuclease RecJ [Hydrogenophaga sp.]NIN58794.1 single-stranded-DNA-specific exonuclease RecJ [Xanthomonadales bacterium]NIN74062.1 single-stranded-DNA-specific exonuclease RecJ [Xanthomonadales bacterium]NIO14591.1 single-stranded-DNA-specific exonuclease RecJ [Xanthomonadales bacterium]